MSGGKLVGGLVGAVILGYSGLAVKRIEYWRPVFDDIARRSDSPPMGEMYVIPGKGCGFTFGETVHAWTTMAGVRTELVMCRNRGGVRFDINTYESHWIRGGPTSN